jgi:H+/gluconate symporter-like permease
MAIGSAGKSRIPLGVVIVGGMLFALILTLFVVPALYSYLSSKKRNVTFEELLEVKEHTVSQEKLETV